MHHKMLYMVGIIVLVVVGASTHGLPVAAHQPDPNPLAGQTRLDGYKIYFAEDNGEASRFDRSGSGISRLAGVLSQLGAQLYTLEWRNNVPVDADLVVIVGPARDLSPEQTARLWAYMSNNGGRVLVLTDPIVDPVKAFPSQKGLFELTWTDMGVRALDAVVVKEGEMRTVTPGAGIAGGADAQATPSGTPSDTTSGPTPATFEAPLLITDLLTADLNTTHPITQGVQGDLAFFGTRPVEVDGSLTNTASLVTSGSEYYGEISYKDYLDTGTVTYTDGEDIARGALSLAAAASDPTTGARIVIIGDRDFATNASGLQTSPPNSPSFVYPGNVTFLLNAISWLVDAEPENMSFPTPGPTPQSEPTSTPENAPAS